MLTAVSEGHNSMGYANPSPFIQRWPVYNSRKEKRTGYKQHSEATRHALRERGDFVSD